MRKWFGLLACLSFSVALIGCEKPVDKKIDKAASEEKKENAEDAKAIDKAIDEDASEMKAEVKDLKKAANAQVDADAKAAKEDAAEDDADTK